MLVVILFKKTSSLQINPGSDVLCRILQKNIESWAYTLLVKRISMNPTHNVMPNCRIELKTRAVVCLIPYIFQYLNGVIFPAFPKDRFEGFVDTYVYGLPFSVLSEHEKMLHRFEKYVKGVLSKK